MFLLTDEEFKNLISQSVTSRWGGRRKLPLAFTEHGAIMAASVLNSDRAVEMSVYVVRVFVQLRAVLLDHKALADKLALQNASVLIATYVYSTGAKDSFGTQELITKNGENQYAYCI